MNDTEKLMLSSLAINGCVSLFILYAWINYWDIFFIYWVKPVVLILLIALVAVSSFSAYTEWGEKGWLTYGKIFIALAGAFMTPYVVLDVYLPPFALLFYGAFAAAVLSYSGFVNHAAGRPLYYAEVVLASAFPLLAPVLFYILYQLLAMPHLIEIAGLCHVSYMPFMRKSGVALKLRSRVREDISRAVRIKLSAEGLL